MPHSQGAVLGFVPAAPGVKPTLILIGPRHGIDDQALQRAFEGCIGTGDSSRSPVLRLVRKIAPELLELAPNRGR